MNKKIRLIIIFLILLLTFLIIIKILNRHPLAGEKFNSPQEALKAYEEYSMEHLKNPLDYNSPYNYIDTIYLGDKGIIIYNKSDISYRVFFSFIEKTKDNRWKFIKGYPMLDVDLRYNEYWQEGNYNFDNIVINNKKYAICFSYLPIDSDKEIYVDGVKSDKKLITIPNGEESFQVYLCYALSNKKDTIISNIKTEVKDRHKYELR